MPAGDGLPELVTPYNTADFEIMVAAVKAHMHALKGQGETVGADLRRLLPHARGVHSRSLGLDLRMAAWQIGRQFGQFAGAMNAGSAAVDRAMQLYHGNFTSGGRPGGRTFDASK